MPGQALALFLFRPLLGLLTEETEQTMARDPESPGVNSCVIGPAGGKFVRQEFIRNQMETVERLSKLGIL